MTWHCTTFWSTVSHVSPRSNRVREFLPFTASVFFYLFTPFSSTVKKKKRLNDTNRPRCHRCIELVFPKNSHLTKLRGVLSSFRNRESIKRGITRSWGESAFVNPRLSSTAHRFFLFFVLISSSYKSINGGSTHRRSDCRVQGSLQLIRQGRRWLDHALSPLFLVFFFFSFSVLVTHRYSVVYFSN